MRDKNYPALVNILVELQKKIDEWAGAIDSQPNKDEVKKQIKRAQKEITKCITDL